MEEQKKVELKSAIQIHQAITEYRDAQYLNMVQQINTRAKAALTDDMGSQFVMNCGRDLAGEMVRNFFDTSDYNITVDQLAKRVLQFSYEDEYDPLANNGDSETIRKNVYNYNDLQSSTLDAISDEMDRSQTQLFPEDRSTDSLDIKGKKAYRESQRDENGDLFDELTGKKGTHTVIQQNGKDVLKSDLHADHVQSREAARYNSKYVTDNGVDALKHFWNSADNMQLMHASANTSKGDVRVCEIDGKIQYLNTKDANYDPKCDITHKATPEQLTEATVQQWTKGKPDSAKVQKLIEEGYLRQDENGNITVPKSVQKALERNIRHSQNVESTIILKNTDYKEVAKDATKHAKAALGKIIAGQIIYYAAPPLVYEVRTILKNRRTTLDDVFTQLKESAKRMGAYILSKIKDIFNNIVVNSLKKFIKSFMDILIGLVKATVKKLLKIAKSLVLSTVDAVRIIADKNASAAEKADSVFNLFGVTITSCVVELLFEFIEKSTGIPEFLLMPLQILATIVCTNLTMLILQKADLFDVRFGFKVNAVKRIFEEERALYVQEMQLAEQSAYTEIEQIIAMAREESLQIYRNLQELDPKTQSVRGQLEGISRMFSMNINFEEEWLKFVGMDGILKFSNVGI